MSLEDIIPSDALTHLTLHTRECIQRLGNHKPESPDLTSFPTNKLAAVLVILFEQDGEIQVLCTTRSKLLRSHPGETALPGGRMDAGEKDPIVTAYREANEEISLTRSERGLYTLTVLEPFLSKFGLLVTPVVSFCTDTALLDGLKASPAEVDTIFHHPLRALLDPGLMRYRSDLAAKQSEHWPFDDDVHTTTDVDLAWLGNTSYRMHRFRSVASPIKGLTSDILIHVAQVAYGQDTVYERSPANQVLGFSAIWKLLETHRPVGDLAIPNSSGR